MLPVVTLTAFTGHIHSRSIHHTNGSQTTRHIYSNRILNVKQSNVKLQNVLLTRQNWTVVKLTIIPNNFTKHTSVYCDNFSWWRSGARFVLSLFGPHEMSTKHQ